MTKIEYKKLNRITKKIKAINYLGGKCEECGETNIFMLEFHHKNKFEKENTIWEIQDNRWSTIEKELKKCKILCGNCHNKLHFGENNNSKWKNNKKIYLEYKGISGCQKCGYNECNSSLDFHHLNTNEKDFMIGEIYITYNSISDLTDKLLDELNKCVVLCKNCHKLEHTDIEFFEKNKDKIIEKSNNLKEVQRKIDRDKIKKLYENGMKQTDIAKYFNASKGTISNIIKELKIKKPTN